MKILLIQENGRHDANRNYRECFCLQRAFVKMGHTCGVWGLGHQNFEQIPNWNSYDWIINLENYDERGWVPSLKGIKQPKKFLWSIDAHCRGEGIYERTFSEGEYDILLHSTKDFVTKDYHRWFPNGFDDTLVKPIEGIQKKHDIGFCGNWVNRRQILEWLRDNHGLHLDIFVIGDNMVKAVNEYRCQFNFNIANDINYRSFETIGCGTLLLTNYNPQYEELGFVDGKNCLMYKNIDELVERINGIKNGSIDWENISHVGLSFSNEHTFYKRCLALIEENNE